MSFYSDRLLLGQWTILMCPLIQFAINNQRRPRATKVRGGMKKSSVSVCLSVLLSSFLLWGTDSLTAMIMAIQSNWIRIRKIYLLLLTIIYEEWFLIPDTVARSFGSTDRGIRIYVRESWGDKEPDGHMELKRWKREAKRINFQIHRRNINRSILNVSRIKVDML